ncbi:MAG: hypothetical protein HY321_08095 [Armatimonadetes bacterium]|nr:hypothetical protein [Armatimonadota bacterium]
MSRRSRFAEWVYWLPIVLWAPIGFALAFEGPRTPNDLDMPEILTAIDARGGVWSCPAWFVEDWPLGNRLYRPVTACSFALDRSLFGDWAPGYRLVSTLLALLTAVLLSLLARAVGGGRGAGALAAGLFLAEARLDLGALTPGGMSFWYLAGAATLLLVGTAIRRRRTPPGRRWAACALAAGVVAYVALFDLADTRSALQWIAARTVVLCTLFAVASLLLLVRHVQTGRSLCAWGSVLLAALSVGAYEQGIVLMPLAAILALKHRRRGAGPVWPMVAAIAAVAVGYWVIRREILGPHLSAYEIACIRPSLARVWSWLRYALPPLEVLRQWSFVGEWAWAWIDVGFWQAAVAQLALIAWILALRGSWRAAWPFWWWRAVAFLPMAALRPMSHYLLLSEAGSCVLNALLVTWAIGRAWDAWPPTGTEDGAPAPSEEDSPLAAAASPAPGP